MGGDIGMFQFVGCFAQNARHVDRRKKLTQAPFPPLWEDILRRNVAHYCMLEDAGRTHLRALIQVFIAEKNWEGAGGLELTDEIRVTISAQACLLLLGLPHNYYRNVESIIVYPLFRLNASQVSLKIHPHQWSLRIPLSGRRSGRGQ